jgi:Uma2 family endonuclease
LIVEVKSPGGAAYDETVKLVAYAHAGVPGSLIVKPQSRSAALFRLAPPGAIAIPPNGAAATRCAATACPVSLRR